MGTCELGELWNQHRSADQFRSHLDQVGIVGDDSATQNHLLGQGIHLQYPLDHRVEDPLDDVSDRLAVTDVL